jgi:uncharacterized protein YciI
MLFILHCKLRRDQASRLEQFRPQHFSHAKSGLVKIVNAGPTLTDDGREIIGGVYIFEAEDRATAERYYSSDPYAREGIWEKTLLEVFDKRV